MLQLQGIRLKLVQAIGVNNIPTGYKIQWGQISSRIDPDSGVKAQDATLFDDRGKPVVWYYASTDEVRTAKEPTASSLRMLSQRIMVSANCES